MPYPPEHRTETRTKILDSARRLFNRNGLTEISIDKIMAGAGLTHGGFYKYFASKEDLYAEAITHFVNCGPIEGWQRAAFADMPPGVRARRQETRARDSRRLSVARAPRRRRRLLSGHRRWRPTWRAAAGRPNAPIGK